MEEFFSNYEYTIEAVGAFSTLVAVIVSLFFSYKSSVAHKPKIRARIMRMTHVDERNVRKWWGDDSYKKLEQQPTESQEFVVVSIKNTGSTPVSMDDNFFHLRMRFFGRSFGNLIMPFLLLDDGRHPDHQSPNPPPINKKTYPIEIKVNGSEMFFVSRLQHMIETLNSGSFKDFGWIRRFFIKALVKTGSGGFVEAKMSKAFKNKIVNVGRI